MNGLLLDEMYPIAAARLLRERGHDVVHVAEVGLRATDDEVVAAAARAEQRGVVTENVRDYARESDVVLVFVLKRQLPAGSAQAPALAEMLHHWLAANPTPYLGAHWPERETRRQIAMRQKGAMIDAIAKLSHLPDEFGSGP